MNTGGLIKRKNPTTSVHNGADKEPKNIDDDDDNCRREAEPCPG
jgi:hypothetical protein